MYMRERKVRKKERAQIISKPGVEARGTSGTPMEKHIQGDELGLLPTNINAERSAGYKICCDLCSCICAYLLCPFLLIWHFIKPFAARRQLKEQEDIELSFSLSGGGAGGARRQADVSYRL